MYFHHFVIMSPLKRAGPFIWTKLNPLHPRMLCAKIGWNKLNGSGEEEFYFVNVFSVFCNYLPFEKRRGPLFEQNWIPFTEGCFVPSLVEIGSVVLENKIFKFCDLVIISFWKKAGPFIWTNVNPLQPRMLCAKYFWNWHNAWRNFLKIFHYRYFLIFPLEKGGALHLKKLESPSTKDALCQVWLILAPWFLRRIFTQRWFVPSLV